MPSMTVATAALVVLAAAVTAPVAVAQDQDAPPRMPPAPSAAAVAGGGTGAGSLVALAPDWCERDAPGTYIKIRQAARQARAEGATGRPDLSCPATAAAETLPEELVVPLPCDRAMVFMRVATPVSTLLDDRVLAFGGTSGDNSLRARYTRGRWGGAVAGTFSAAEAGGPARPDLSDLASRAYYMGAYEVTALQYDLYTRGILEAWSAEAPPSAAEADALCADHRAMADDVRHTKVMPASQISWFDAVAFTRALNAYVTAETRRRIAAGKGPLLPWEMGSPGFIRLPAEAEWEYAARGGAVSADDEASARTYSILERDGSTTRPASLEEIAVVSDMSSKTVLRGVGRLSPNLLGLYDTVGNVAEITHDLFRMTRPDRLQGVRGGFVLRGGHAMTPRSNQGIGHRAEEPLYDARGEGRTAFSGMRLAVVAPVFVNGVDRNDPYRTDLLHSEFNNALATAHEQLTSSGFTPGADHRRDARALLSNLRATDSVEDVRARLAELEGALEASEAALNTAAQRELEEKLRAASIGAVAVRSLGRLAYVIRLRIEQHKAEAEEIPVGMPERDELEERLAQLEKNWRKLEDQTTRQIRHVLGTAAELAQVPDAPLSDAFKTVREQFVAQRLDDYQTSFDIIREVVDAEKKGVPGDLFETYATRLDDNREIRAKRFGIDLGIN